MLLCKLVKYHARGTVLHCFSLTGCQHTNFCTIYATDFLEQSLNGDDLESRGTFFQKEIAKVLWEPE